MKQVNLKVSIGLNRSVKLFCRNCATVKRITTKGMQMATRMVWTKGKFWNFLYVFLFIILISIPSFLFVPTKGRESGGVVLDSKEYTKELTCLINTLYAEAKSEPEEGIRAVMSVIYNRKNHKNYPNTFCKVILQDKQFSAFNSDKSLATKRLKPVKGLDEEAYTKVAGIAQEAVVGAFKPVLEPSVLWYAHIRVKNKWTRKFERVKVIASHSFYKEI